MKLEDQFTNLELSKKLKELGVEQESLYIWTWHKNKFYPKASPNWFLMCTDSYDYDSYPGSGEEEINAFSVAELGEMLPVKWGEIVYNENRAMIWTEKGMGDDMKPFWTIRYFGTGSECLHQEDEENEVDVRAKMLIWLIENKIIKGGEKK